MLRQFVLFACVCALSARADAALVTHFNFNTYDGDSSTIAANSGGGTISLGGGIISPWPSNELSDPAGTPVNAVGGDLAGKALGLGNIGAGTTARWMTIAFSTAGLHDVQLSFAGSANGSTYNQASVWYSINGDINEQYVNTGITFDPAASNNFSPTLQSLSSVTAINDQATVHLRLYFTRTQGSLNSNHVLAIDNLQVNAASVPEPTVLGMVVTSLFPFGVLSWRRRRARPVIAEHV